MAEPRAGACWCGSTSSTTGSRRSRPGTTASGSSAISTCGAKAPSTRCTTPAPCSSSSSTTRRGRNTWWSTTASAPVAPAPSAGSGELLCEGREERAAIVVAQPSGQLGGGELAVGLGHGPLAVRPAGLDRVQPRALARQAADQQPATGAGGLDPAVVAPDPGAHLAADVPRGVVPDKSQDPYALGREPAGRPGEEGAGDAAHRPSGDEPQQGPPRLGQPHAVAGKRLRVGVVAVGPVHGQAQALAGLRPGVQGGLRQPREPDLVLEAERPPGPAPRQGDQPVAPTFFCA